MGKLFATIRQLGASFELAASYLEWLRTRGDTGLDPAIAAFASISTAAKTLILKAARAVGARRTVDFAPQFGEMAAAWDQGVSLLAERYPAEDGRP